MTLNGGSGNYWPIPSGIAPYLGAGKDRSVDILSDMHKKKDRTSSKNRPVDILSDLQKRKDRTSGKNRHVDI